MRLLFLLAASLWKDVHSPSRVQRSILVGRGLVTLSNADAGCYMRGGAAELSDYGDQNPRCESRYENRANSKPPSRKNTHRGQRLETNPVTRYCVSRAARVLARVGLSGTFKSLAGPCLWLHSRHSRVEAQRPVRQRKTPEWHSQCTPTRANSVPATPRTSLRLSSSTPSAWASKQLA